MDTASTLPDIHFFRAGEKDIADLVRLRIDFMIDLFGLQPEEVIERQLAALTIQFGKGIREGTYISWLAAVEGEAVGCGGLAVREQPGNLVNISGRAGYLMNMYTTPAYRGRGICSTLVDKLVESAKEQGIFHFELNATEAGARVYKERGFYVHHEPTLRRHDA